MVDSSHLTMSSTSDIDIIEENQETFRSSRSLKAWNITTSLSLIIPLLIFFSARVMNRVATNSQDVNEYESYVYGENNDDSDGKLHAPWWCKFSK